MPASSQKGKGCRLWGSRVFFNVYVFAFFICLLFSLFPFLLIHTFDAQVPDEGALSGEPQNTSIFRDILSQACRFTCNLLLTQCVEGWHFVVVVVAFGNFVFLIDLDVCWCEVLMRNLPEGIIAEFLQLPFQEQARIWMNFTQREPSLNRPGHYFRTCVSHARFARGLWST